jgi:hypothetical protein
VIQGPPYGLGTLYGKDFDQELKRNVAETDRGDQEGVVRRPPLPENGFERSYTLAGSAREHEPEVIRRLILQLIPANSE